MAIQFTGVLRRLEGRLVRIGFDGRADGWRLAPFNRSPIATVRSLVVSRSFSSYSQLAVDRLNRERLEAPENRHSFAEEQDHQDH